MSSHLNGHRPFEQHALQLAKKHLVRVHPLRPASKVAILDDWPVLATTDEATIAQWVERYPTSNIGIAPSPRGLVVDVDPRKGGWEGLQMLEDAALADLPRETLSVLTGGSDEGLHLYFRLPDGITVPSSRTVAAGVEVKSYRAYLVAPGSIHPESGNEYRWVDPDASILDAPAWLVELVAGASEIDTTVPVGEERLTEETTAYGRAALEEECRRVGDTPLGGDGRVEGRNKQVRNSSYAVGTLIAGGEIRYDEAVASLSDAIDSWEPADGDPVKTRKTLMRGLSDGMNHPRNAPDDGLEGLWIPETVGPIGLVASVSDVSETSAPANERTVDDWPDPITPTSSLPTFPADAFVEWLREFVEAEATATQTPVDMTAFAVLGVLSTATGNRVEVRLASDWVEPVHVWTLVALPPAERKSAVLSDVLRPLYVYERAERDRQAPEIRVLESKRKIAEGRLAAAEKAAVKAFLPVDRLEAEAALDEARHELDEITVPAPFQLVFDDLTPEAFGQALGDQGRVTIASAEGGVFDTFGGRYSQGTSNIDALLKSHAAEPLRITRLSRPQLLIERACATLVFAVQPAVVSGLSRKPGFRGRGLLARFLYSLPQSSVGNRAINPPGVPEHVKAVYHARIVELLDRLKPVQTVEGGERPNVLTLTSEADARLTEWRTMLEPQLGERGRLVTISDWAGKLAGTAVRLAGLLHFAEHGSLGVDEKIDERTINGALRIADYLIPHARAALDLLDEDDVAADARAILSWIVEHHPDDVAPRDVVKGISRIKTVNEATPALVLLEHRGFLRPLDTDRQPGQVGRPPSRRWIPNPKLWLPESIGKIGKTPSEAGFADFADIADRSADANRGES